MEELLNAVQWMDEKTQLGVQCVEEDLIAMDLAKKLYDDPFMDITADLKRECHGDVYRMQALEWKVKLQLQWVHQAALNAFWLRVNQMQEMKGFVRFAMNHRNPWRPIEQEARYLYSLVEVSEALERYGTRLLLFPVIQIPFVEQPQIVNF